MFIPDSKAGKWLAWCGTVGGILFIIRDNIKIVKENYELATVLTLSLFLVIFFVYIVWREYNVSRKERYANICANQHRCIHLLRDLTTILTRNLKSISSQKEKQLLIDNCITILQDVLTEFSTTFSILTGTLCRASIKSIYEKDGELYVYTLARDKKSADANFEQDQKRFKENLDPLKENIDFKLLYEKFGQNQRCFFSNNLALRRNYCTSSFKIYGYPPDNISFFQRIVTFFKKDNVDNWPLPYISTIVWPIQQRDTQTLKIEKPECIGFLAIDSDSRGVFRKKWDFHLGAEVADALFHPLLLFSRLYKA